MYSTRSPLLIVLQSNKHTTISQHGTEVYMTTFLKYSSRRLPVTAVVRSVWTSVLTWCSRWGPGWSCPVLWTGTQSHAGNRRPLPADWSPLPASLWGSPLAPSRSPPRPACCSGWCQPGSPQLGGEKQTSFICKNVTFTHYTTIFVSDIQSFPTFPRMPFNNTQKIILNLL